MSCGTCGIQAGDTMQGDTGVPAGAPTLDHARCPRCQAFIAQPGAPCRNPRCPSRRATPPATVLAAGHGTRPASVPTPEPPRNMVPGLEPVKAALQVALAGGYSLCLIAAEPDSLGALPVWAQDHGLTLHVIPFCACGRPGPSGTCLCSRRQANLWRKQYGVALAADMVVLAASTPRTAGPPPPARHEGPASTGADDDEIVATARIAREQPPVAGYTPDARMLRLLRAASPRLDFVRTDGVFRLAATIARLASVDSVSEAHVRTALSYMRLVDPVAYTRRRLAAGVNYRLEDLPPGLGAAKYAFEVALAGNYSVTIGAQGGGQVEALVLADWARRHGIRGQATFSCPCGYYPGWRCTCTPEQVRDWWQRPAQQRVLQADLLLSVEGTGQDYIEDLLLGRRRGEPEQEMLARVALVQSSRTPERLPLDDMATTLLRGATQQLDLDAVEHERLRRIATTMARLRGAREVNTGDVVSATHLRQPRGWGPEW